MRIKISCLLLLFFILHADLYSQTLIIPKENPDDPSEELILYSYNQAFFDFKIPIAKIKTGDMNGVNVNLTESSCLYIDYGPYKAYFFAEPGKSYTINLPYTKAFANDWKRNPYFKPSHFHMQVSEIGERNLPSQLNENIRIFDSHFEPFADKQILRYYDPEFAKEKLDSFLLTEIIPDSLISPDFYQSYIFYKKGLLEFNLKTHNLDELSAKYFINKKIQFSNPAYRELFTLMFQSYFNYLADKNNYSDINLYLATKQYQQIKDYVSDIELFNKEIIFSNILLNELYQAYYSKYFDKKKLLNTLETLIQNASDSSILYSARELERSFISLEAGYPAPEFSFISIFGDERKLTDFKDKYVYLCFTDLESLSALRELEYLKNLYSRFSKNLEILYCVIGTEESEIKSFVEWHNIKWDVFSVTQNDNLLADYKVMALPIFYLIDMEGILSTNPAPNPSENFENIFSEILRSVRNL